MTECMVVTLRLTPDDHVNPQQLKFYHLRDFEVAFLKLGQPPASSSFPHLNIRDDAGFGGHMATHLFGLLAA